MRWFDWSSAIRLTHLDWSSKALYRLNGAKIDTTTIFLYPLINLNHWINANTFLEPIKLVSDLLKPYKEAIINIYIEKGRDKYRKLRQHNQNKEYLHSRTRWLKTEPIRVKRSIMFYFFIYLLLIFIIFYNDIRNFIKIYRG